jgi:hypothetical protein
MRELGAGGWDDDARKWHWETESAAASSTIGSYSSAADLPLAVPVSVVPCGHFRQRGSGAAKSGTTAELQPPTREGWRLFAFQEVCVDWTQIRVPSVWRVGLHAAWGATPRHRPRQRQVAARPLDDQ